MLAVSPLVILEEGSYLPGVYEHLLNRRIMQPRTLSKLHDIGVEVSNDSQRSTVECPRAPCCTTSILRQIFKKSKPQRHSICKRRTRHVLRWDDQTLDLAKLSKVGRNLRTGLPEGRRVL